MQPKSIATVVVRLPGTLLASSMPAAAEVMSASVVSGLISEMLPTVVVLPTPKPPAITSLTGSGGRRRAGLPPTSADCAETTDHPQERVDVGGRVGVRQVDRQVTVGGQVADQHPDHAEVQRQLRGDLRDGQRVAAERDD